MIDFIKGFIEGLLEVLTNWWVLAIIAFIALIKIFKEKRKARDKLEQEKRIANSIESIAKSMNKKEIEK